MLSVRFSAYPCGYHALGGETSISLAVKSVSTAEVATHRRTSMGPVTSVGSHRGSVWNTSTSGREPSGR
jgi:hypothetical protein